MQTNYVIIVMAMAGKRTSYPVLPGPYYFTELQLFLDGLSLTEFPRMNGATTPALANPPSVCLLNSKRQWFMEIFTLKNDVPVFGFQVKTFPDGIGEAFDSLIAMVPEGLNRSYYGISYMTPRNEVVYIASVEEKNSREAEKNNCTRYVVEKGKYLTVTVREWRQKTDSIKYVFEDLMKERNVDLTKPCVEWYKNDEEMLCMVKIIPAL